jgi:hypothetical protein
MLLFACYLSYHLPDLRLAQAAALSEPNTFLSSAMDLGSLHPLPYASIHPTNKQELACRLALAIRHAMLADEVLVFAGPVAQSATATATTTKINSVVASANSRLASGRPAVDPAAAAIVESAAASATSTVTVTVNFTLQKGSGGLALNTTASCTPQVLDVFCPRELHGFEVRIPP